MTKKQLLGLFSVAACGAAPHPTRTPPEQHRAGVRITNTCITAEGVSGGGYGSGVIVSKEHILTALHVVTCNGISVLTIDVGDGIPLQATVELTLPQLDIARLKLKAKISGRPAIHIGPRPVIGERVCEASAVPRWTYRCFTVGPQLMKETTRIFVDGFVEFGNSGSAVYNSFGQLIGLMDATAFCQDGLQCVGAIAPLQDLDYLIPLE